MKRMGSVLVFKAGVSKAQVAAALQSIKAVLDVPAKSSDMVPVGDRKVTFVDRPFKFEDLVHEYDSEYGGPVWYIP